MFSQSDFAKAEQFFNKGNYSKAKEIFIVLYQKKPNDVTVMEYLGDIEGYSKNWDGALEYYEKLKKIKPLEANYFYKYGGALGMKAKESNKFKALGMIDDVEDAFKNAIKLNSKHLEARWALIELYLQLPGIVGGSEKKAQKYSNELMILSPVDGYLSKGHIAEYFKRYKEAEKNYKKAVEIGKSKMTYQKLADLYKNKMKQPEKAKAILEEYTEKSKT
jgi:tetratricopeptide (TPR) repeat protein